LKTEKTEQKNKNYSQNNCDFRLFKKKKPETFVSVSSTCQQRDNTELNHPYTVHHTGGLTLSVLYSDTLNSCHSNALTLMDDTL